MFLSDDETVRSGPCGRISSANILSFDLTHTKKLNYFRSNWILFSTLLGRVCGWKNAVLKEYLVNSNTYLITVHLWLGIRQICLYNWQREQSCSFWSNQVALFHINILREFFFSYSLYIYINKPRNLTKIKLRDMIETVTQKHNYTLMRIIWENSHPFKSYLSSNPTEVQFFVVIWGPGFLICFI